MKPVTIYTTPTAATAPRRSGCSPPRASAFEEIDVRRDPARRQRDDQRAGGRRTVPQIFIGEDHIGGCDDLYALEQAGGLDRALADG